MSKIKQEVDISKIATGWPYLMAMVIGLLVFGVLPSGAWYLLFSLFEPFTSFLLYAAGAGICFGLIVYQVRVESRAERREPLSTATTLKAIGMGVGCGLAFLVSGVVLGALYAQVEPPAGAFSLWAFGVRVLVGMVLSAAVGVTYYLPLAAKYLFVNTGNLFLYHGNFFSIFMGPIGGATGAIFGALDSTPAAPWWLRLLAAVGVGGVGAILGLIVGIKLTDLFCLLYKGDTDDTVVVPVDEAEFQAIFLGKNGQYRMEINPSYRTPLRYMAAYRRAESAITHLARVKSVKLCKDQGPHQYMIYVHSPATAIAPIRLTPEGKVKGHLMGRRYTSRALLQKARTLDEVFLRGV